MKLFKIKVKDGVLYKRAKSRAALVRWLGGAVFVTDIEERKPQVKK